MPSKAHITVAGDAKALQDQIERVNKRLAKTEQKLRDVKGEGKRGGREIERGFGSVAKRVGEVAAGLTLANMAAGTFRRGLQLIVGELENIKRRRLEAAAVAGDVGQARAIAMGNLPAGIGAKQVDEMVQAAATRPGMQIPLARGYQIAGPMLSAMGGMPFEYLRASFMETARESATTGGAPAGAFGGAVLDVIKGIPRLRAMKPRAAARAGAGLLEQFGKAARITERPEQARALTLGAGLAGGAGVSEERTLELIAALTQFGDVTGPSSVTAVTRLYKNLGIARTRGFGYGGAQPFRISGRGDAAIDELMAGVRGMDPGQQDVFFANFPLGKGATGFAMRQILTGTDVGRARLTAAERAIGAPGTGGAERQRTIGIRESGRWGRQAQVSRAMTSLIEQGQMMTERRALAGEVIGKMPDVLRTYGQGALAQTFANWETLIGYDRPFETAIQQIERARMGLTRREYYGQPGPYGQRMSREIASPDEVKQADAQLREMIELLRSIRAQLENKNAEPQTVQVSGPGSVNSNVEPDR